MKFHLPKKIKKALAVCTACSVLLARVQLVLLHFEDYYIGIKIINKNKGKLSNFAEKYKLKILTGLDDDDGYSKKINST